MKVEASEYGSQYSENCFVDNNYTYDQSRLSEDKMFCENIDFKDSTRFSKQKTTNGSEGIQRYPKLPLNCLCFNIAIYP